MTNRFRQFIEDNRLFGPGDRVLLAVSGGLDSVVMAALFREAGYSFGIAHCNFQLRGPDSDEDAAFVRTTAAALAAPCYEKNFATREYAVIHGLSIQMAARHLRYEWLEEVRRRESYHFIATAHHLNDSLETVLYNFTKGTGLRGLTGIPLRNEHVIRPLLFAARTELEAFARDHRLAWREDVSNREEKYDRNKIRLQVVPALKEINSALEQTVAGNLRRLGETQTLFEWAVSRWKEKLVKEETGRLTIDYRELRDHPAARTLLHEWLSGLGFTASQLDDLLAASPPATGAHFRTDTHVLLVDRERLLIEEHKEQTMQVFELPAGQAHLALPDGILHVEWRSGRPRSFPEDPLTAYLDGHTLHFPLRLRHWLPGDVFCPLGMDGSRQKLQDFFSNLKLDRLAKEKVWIVEEAGGEIVWVVGHRIDERRRIREDTDGYLVLQFEKGHIPA